MPCSPHCAPGEATAMKSLHAATRESLSRNEDPAETRGERETVLQTAQSGDGQEAHTDRSPKTTHRRQRAHETVPNTGHHCSMQIRATVRHHLTPVRMAIIRKSTNSKCWRGCGKKEILRYWWEYKLIQPLQRIVRKVFKKLNMENSRSSLKN